MDYGYARVSTREAARQLGISAQTFARWAKAEN